MDKLEKKHHIVIFELITEEESVLTLFNLFKKCGFRVSLCLSNNIWNLIKRHIKITDSHSILVFNPSDSISNIYNDLNFFIQGNDVDLIVMPRFSPTSLKEISLALQLMKKESVCVGAFSYRKWISTTPPITLNGSLANASSR